MKTGEMNQEKVNFILKKLSEKRELLIEQTKNSMCTTGLLSYYFKRNIGYLYSILKGRFFESAPYL